MNTDARAALDGAAEALRASATAHKSAERRHRKEARAQLARLDALRQECARLGITLQIDKAPKEAKSHARTAS